MKVESRPEVRPLSFPNTSARIIYIILRGPARKVTTLNDDNIVWEKSE